MLRSLKTRLFLLTFLILLFSIPLLFGQGMKDLMRVPAAPAAMGEAYVAYPKDGNAPIWNPAAMELMEYRVLSATFSRDYLGVNANSLNEGYLAYTHHFGRKGSLGSVGIYWSQFFSDVLSHGELALSLGKRVWGKRTGKQLSLGVNAKFFRNSLNTNQFEGVEGGDPALGNESKMTYSLDAGVYYRPLELMSFGVVAKDFLQPEIGLYGKDTLGMRLRGGVAFHTKFMKPQVELEYNNNSSNKFSVHMGAEKNLMNNFALRTGLSADTDFDGDFGVGFSYLKSQEKMRWEIDYSFLYPMNKLGSFETHFSTHKLGLNVYFAPPPVPDRDVELVDGEVSASPTDLFVGNPVNLSATVRNNGEKDEGNVKVSLYYKDTSGVWTLAQPIDKIGIEMGEKKKITYEWTPPHQGHYTMYMGVDDNGSKIPKVNGHIPEVDEENNLGVGEFNVFKPPSGRVEPSEHNLEVSELTLMREERPIIPTVFFEKNSSQVRDKYNYMLETVANRLKENPDVSIHIKGYYSKGSDDAEDGSKLALNRAEHTKKRLLELGAPDGQVVIDRKGYDFSESRAGTPEEQLNIKSRQYQYEENRRAKLHAVMTGSGAFSSQISFQKDLGSEQVSKLRSTLSQIRQTLNRNNEAIVVVDGIHVLDDQKSMAQAFDRASKTIRWLRDKLSDEYKDDVYLTSSYDSVGKPRVHIFSNGDGTIYRPALGDMVMKDYAMAEDSAQNLIQIDAQVDAGVDSFAISIIDTAGKVVRRLAAGKGKIPNGLGWNWRDEAGRLLDFQNKYLCKMDIVDELGKHFRTTSDTMSIKVTKKAKKIERLIIVEYLFEKAMPQSKFLESRIEHTARRLINKAKEMPDSLLATVEGHTDSIGAEYANRALSKKRANRERGRLQNYLIYLLNLKNEKELNNWLKEHNVNLRAKGYWETEPYVISVWKEGESKKVHIGDNSSPEGRTINRRVLLELKSKFRGEE